MIQRSMTLSYDWGRLRYISEPDCGLYAFTCRILRRSRRLKVFLQPVQRLPLIQNLVELEKEAADNDVAMALMLANQLNRRQRRRRMRQYWVRPLLGQYERLNAELLVCFQEFCQDGPGNISGTSSQVGPQINQERYRKALNPKLKLVIIHRYLATGVSYRTLMYGVSSYS